MSLYNDYIEKIREIRKHAGEPDMIYVDVYPSRIKRFIFHIFRGFNFVQYDGSWIRKDTYDLILALKKLDKRAKFI